VTQKPRAGREGKIVVIDNPSAYFQCLQNAFLLFCKYRRAVEAAGVVRVMTLLCCTTLVPSEYVRGILVFPEPP
jgi:hypothetical protein